MRSALILLGGFSLILVAPVSGQTVRDWTSDSDQRWSRSANWSGNNVPSSKNEIAQFGAGTQLNPLLNANNRTVRGIRFTADTKWQAHDSQITPVREPATYGAGLVALVLAGGWWRCRRRA